MLRLEIQCSGLWQEAVCRGMSPGRLAQETGPILAINFTCHWCFCGSVLVLTHASRNLLQHLLIFIYWTAVFPLHPKGSCEGVSVSLLLFRAAGANSRDAARQVVVQQVTRVASSRRHHKAM